jgi:serine/threonine protein kinase
MGAVYLAQHSFMGWRAAVKILHRSLADDKLLVSRFLNEGRAAKSIAHPNVIEIIDVGVLENGLPYLLMELLEGEMLSARIKRLGKLGVQASLEIASQAAAGLAAAHEAGVIHRDLKPDNLFLVPDPDRPGREKVKVLDFGIAKLCDDAEAVGGPRPNTKHGVLLGTPAYMSPEQCRGIPVDHRCDIYALAIILYEMLVGTPPFVGSGQGDLLLMHVEAPPPPVRLANPEVPQFVEAAILRALAKPREQRFATMREMGEALGGEHQITAELPLAKIPPPLEATRQLTPVTPFSWSTSTRKHSPILRGQIRAVVLGALVVVPVLILIASDVVRAPPPPVVNEPRPAPIVPGKGGLRSEPPIQPTPPDEPPPARESAPVATERRPLPAARPVPPDKRRPPAGQTVSLRVLNPPIGLTVRVDGRPVSLPVRLPRDGRNHLLEFAAPKFAPEVRIVRADQDQSLNLDNTPVIRLD